jgi:hypothetical protein
MVIMSAFKVVNPPIENPLKNLFDFSYCKSLDNIKIMNIALIIIQNTLLGILLSASLSNSKINKIIFVESNNWKMEIYDKTHIAIVFFPDFFNINIPFQYFSVKKENKIVIDDYPCNKVLNVDNYKVIAATLFHELFHIIQFSEELIAPEVLREEDFPNLEEQQAVAVENLIRRIFNLPIRANYNYFN